MTINLNNINRPTKDSAAETSLCKCGDDTHFNALNIEVRYMLLMFYCYPPPPSPPPPSPPAATYTEH